jgi:hypothetical protein
MVMIKDIEYAGDGSTMIGRLALPEGDDQGPAVLIAHEGGGLDDYQKGCQLLQTSPESRVVGPWTRPGEGRTLDSTNGRRAKAMVPFS